MLRTLQPYPTIIAPTLFGTHRWDLPISYNVHSIRQEIQAHFQSPPSERISQNDYEVLIQHLPNFVEEELIQLGVVWNPQAEWVEVNSFLAQFSRMLLSGDKPAIHHTVMPVIASIILDPSPAGIAALREGMRNSQSPPSQRIMSSYLWRLVVLLESKIEDQHPWRTKLLFWR